MIPQVVLLLLLLLLCPEDQASSSVVYMYVVYIYIYIYTYIHTYIHVNVCSDEKTPASKLFQRGDSFMLQRPEYIITNICKCALGTGYSSTKMKHGLFMPESLNSTLWSA